MKKKLIVIIPLIIAVVTFIFVYRYYNKEDKTTTLTVSEKRWVEENNEKEYDFEVVNDYPLYGLNGSGVIFDFIDDFEEKIGIEFNKIPYLKTSIPTENSFRIRILSNDEKPGKKDLPLFVDNYVAVGSKYQRINHVEDIKNQVIGIFKEDSEDISFYLKTGTNISFKTYSKIEDLYTALDNNEVNMIIVPNIMHLNYTIQKNKYYINYYFNEMKKQIVLTLSDNNKELNTIVTKYYNKWRQTNFIEEYNAEYLNYYLETNQLDAKTKATLISKNYIYGYIENAPYEVKVKGKVAGIAGEYIDRISRLADINFKYKKYSSISALQKAVDKGEVDVYFDYYNISGKEYVPTISTFIEDYVVIGKQKDNHVVTSFESLKNQEIAMIKDNSLYNYFKNNSRAKIKTYKDIDDLVKNAGTRLIVVDNEIYSHYQSSKFKKFNLIYRDTMMNDYKFMVKDNNAAFYDLFNYIINTNSYYNYRNSGIENLTASILEDSTLEQVYFIVLTVIFAPIVILLTIYLIIKRKKQIKKIKITDRHKYTDMLTSLKNRNVNDNYGHEEGDQLIIKAAGILVNTQLENSEIIRTDGNEFLIYLVGYSERQISTYTKKLSKEMKNLPHEFGAALGFSMITDEIKTLDDAINEATLEMITNKEDYK